MKGGDEMPEKKPIRNPVIEAIGNRRSVRSYKPDPIPRDILNTLIEAGNMAPTGTRQSWRFVVVEDPELRRKLQKRAFFYSQKRFESWKETHPEWYEVWEKARASYEDPVYRSAPVILFVIGTAKMAGWKGLEMADCSMVCQNIMLAAYSLDIGSCWVGSGARIFSGDPKVFGPILYGPKSTDDPDIVKALELEEGETIYGPIILGYPVHYPEPPPKKPPVVKWI